MAKNIRRMLAMVLVLCMFVSALPMQALAAEEAPFTKTETFTGESVTIETPSESEIIVSGNNDSGAALNITGTSESKSDSYKDENTDTEIQKDTTHVELSGTESADGVDKKVEYMEDKTVITETETDGTITEKTTVDGLEKKEWNEYDVEPGQEVPSVQVQLQPGATNSNSGSGSYTKEEDNVAGGSTAQNSDKTTTTTEVDRVVEGTRSEASVNVEKSEAVLKPVVDPLDYNISNGKHYSDTYVLKQDAEGNNYVDPNGLLKGDYTDFNAGKVPPQPEGANGQGYDFYASGLGDITDAAAPVWMNLVYNADGSINWEESTYVDAGYIAGETGMMDQTSTIVVMDKNGNKFYTYCIDNDTPVEGNYWYRVANLEDNEYYSEESAAQIRAIVQNGYWGTGSDTGSIDSIKALLTEYAEDHPTVTVTNEAGEAVEIELTEELINGLVEHEALAVTQSAIWSYANGSSATMSSVGIVGVSSAIKYYNSQATSADKGGLLQYARDYDLNSDARMAALYDCLMNLEGIPADEAPTTIINEKHNFKDMYLTVNGKVEDAAANYDGQKENDVYHVDLQFTLDFDLNVDDDGNLKDDLYVTLLGADKQPIKDADGNDIRRKLSLTEEEGSIVANKDGVYTLTDLELAEGEDFEFSLQLDGTQAIEESVYVYQPYEGRENSQTLVGLASGTQDVSITVSSTLSFKAEERTHIKEERVWHHAYDPIVTPPETPVPPVPPTPPVVINEEPPVQQVFRLNNQEEAVEEIPEEPVPLAAPVITGDNSGLWIAVMLLSVFAMAAINLFDKKRQHEAF